MSQDMTTMTFTHAEIDLIMEVFETLSGVDASHNETDLTDTDDGSSSYCPWESDFEDSPAFNQLLDRFKVESMTAFKARRTKPVRPLFTRNEWTTIIDALNGYCEANDPDDLDTDLSLLHQRVCIASRVGHTTVTPS